MAFSKIARCESDRIRLQVTESACTTHSYVLPLRSVIANTMPSFGSSRRKKFFPFQLRASAMWGTCLGFDFKPHSLSICVYVAKPVLCLALLASYTLCFPSFLTLASSWASSCASPSATSVVSQRKLLLMISKLL